MGQPHCSNCHPISACPYDLAKAAALAAPLAVANTSYAFLEWGAKGAFKNFDLVVCDEWDILEDTLFNTLNVELTPRDLLRFQIALPKGPIDAAWVTGAADALAKFYDQSREDPPDDWPQIGQRAGDLRTAASGLKDRSWIVLSQTLERGVNIGPIEVGRLGQQHLWPHGKRWLLMSGTAIDARLRLQKLGWTGLSGSGRTSFSDALTRGKGRYLRVPSVYPAVNRPIYVWPVAPMVKAQREASIPKLATAIAQILDNHKNDRILIHTGTYDITQKLQDLLSAYRARLVSFTNARGREEALARYLKQDGAVLMGPAMERGLSLDDEACKVVVLCRVPYPYRGDPRVAERAKQGGLWWQLQSIETIATIVQMTMRHIRHAKDTGKTFILDSQFQRIRTHGLYANRWPKWWTESLVDFRGF
jgi:Rad3-related DNA helicase